MSRSRCSLYNSCLSSCNYALRRAPPAYFLLAPPTLLLSFALFLLSAGTVSGRLCRLRLERDTERTVGGMTMVDVMTTVAVGVTTGAARESAKGGKVTLVTVPVGIVVEERGDPVVLVPTKG